MEEGGPGEAALGKRLSTLEAELTSLRHESREAADTHQQQMDQVLKLLGGLASRNPPPPVAGTLAGNMVDKVRKSMVRMNSSPRIDRRKTMDLPEEARPRTASMRADSVDPIPENETSRKSPQQVRDEKVKVLADEIQKKTEEDEGTEYRFMINPSGPFRMTWDLGVVAPLLLYLTVAVPFRLSFENDPPLYSGMYWFEFSFEMIFLVDIALNFRTGYFTEALDTNEPVESLSIEYQPFNVAYNYLTGWFGLDAASGIPFALIDLISGGESTSNAAPLKMLKSLRLLRFVKLMNLFKLSDILATLDDDSIDRIEDFVMLQSTQTGLLFLKLTLRLAFTVHIAACIYVYTGRNCSKAGLDNWLTNEMKGPFDWRDTMAGSPDVGSIYLAAFYFVLTTMTSVGFGDIITRNNTERILVCFFEFVGGFTYATIIASITSVVTHSDMNTAKTNEQLESVSSFIETRDIPVDLGRRIRSHFRQFYSNKSAIDERKIFMEMSASLRREVSTYLVAEKMRNVKIFQTMSPKLWPRLLPILNPTRFAQDEVVCEQGDEAAEMFIINEGQLLGVSEVPNAPLKPRARSISSGDSINVLCVLKVWNRSVERVTALTHVGSYAVSSDEFYGLFNHDNEIDSLAFADIVAHELRNFKMFSDPAAPTALGMPLYMSFSRVSVMVVAAEGIIAADTTLISRESTSDPYAIIEMVDQSTRRQLNTRWFHRTPTIHKTLHPCWTTRNSVQWKDVHLPFENLALRVRVVDEDTVGNDDTIGEVFLSLSSLMEVESPSNNQGLPPPGPSRRPSKWHDVRVLDKMRTHSQMRTSLVERPRGRPNIMNIFKAAVDKVKPEGPTDGEVAAKLGAEDGRVVDKWYPIEAPADMIAQAKKTGQCLPAKLGRIRICTWIKEQDFNDNPAEAAAASGDPGGSSRAAASGAWAETSSSSSAL
eukprot:CAMPEP_0172607538 /NCGR_PEP_ID=MMETSP1068-20121228/27690_1 /TAXON_ID=35684 /ORGANISM="Pseudopedinella elastica, Strain CCMP716" /LENGTH=935 /DNA_ID=CAMNT_0013410567 /DNA_START=183 /DNA_END=2990 /DNA_ORIENTATION=-